MFMIHELISIDYVQLSIPIFLLLIVAEVFYSRKKHKFEYRLSDSITNIATGALQNMTALVFGALTIAAYVYIHKNYALFDFRNLSNAQTWVMAISLIVLCDFLYYWFHRMSHEIKIMWAGHVVHHQSEEYNLSVALRQGTFQQFFSWPFYLPLAFIGFEPIWFASMISLVTAYQFWIHTEHIDKLGPFEWIFNTPSHHRVHHGVDPEYLDKNHAGLFIIWDRMFGTFQLEKQRPQYGTVVPLKSWNPVWANLEYFKEIYLLSKKCRGWDKLLVWFRSPEWVPVGKCATADLNREKFDIPLTPKRAQYALTNFTIVVAVAFMFLTFFPKLKETQALIIYSFLIISFALIGGLLENKKWIKITEPIRITTTLVGFFGLVSYYLAIL